MMFKKQFLVGINSLLAVMLVGCSTPKLYHQADQGINNVEQRIAETELPGKFPVVQASQAGSHAVDLSFNLYPTLPAWGKNSINITSRNLPMQYIVEKVLNRTGAVADYQNDVNQNTPVSLAYSGSVKGALDRIAAATNYAYSLDGNTLIWAAQVTKTFDISFMPGVSQYQVGRTASSGKSLQGGVGNTIGLADENAQYSNLQGNLSVWNDLTQTLNNLKSSDGKIFVSQATTSVTVTDHPQNIRTIATYLKQLNRDLSRQVALDVQVLQVDLADAYEYGINWNMIKAFTANGTRVGLEGSLAQSINLQPLNGGGSSGFLLRGAQQADGNFLNSVLIKALSQQGKVSVVTQPRTVTLNNQLAELSINTQRSYLQQVTVTQGTAFASGNTTSVTPGVVSTGFNLYILPKIQGDRVYLQISSTLANLIQIPERTFGEEKQGNKYSIQLPEINEKRFNQRTLVPSGATLIVAGFKQLSNTANKQQLFGQQALGGHGAEKNNSEIILLITPTILENNS